MKAIFVKSGIINLMNIASSDLKIPGITVGFAIAQDYLIKIAGRAIELNDSELLAYCNQICLLTEVTKEEEENFQNLLESKSREKHLVSGVTTGNKVNSRFWDDQQQGIDIFYEDSVYEIKSNDHLSESEKSDKLLELEYSYYSGTQWLVGDWIKKDNKFEINKSGSHGYSATYDSNDNHIVVEWSKTTKQCRNTSPCFHMKDGRPCGDLDSEGDDVEAYDLPEEYYLED